MRLALPMRVCLIFTFFFLFGQQEASAQKGKGKGQNQQAPAEQQTPTPQPQATPTQVPVEQPKADEAGKGRQEQQEKPEGWFTPEWATVLLNFLVLLIIAFQTAIYRNQLSEMRLMKGVSDRQATMMENQVTAMQSQLELMQSQTAAMQESLNETRISREIENRAFVTMRKIEIDGGLDTVVETGGVTIRLEEVNVGKTPARNVRVQARAAFLPPVHDLQPLPPHVSEQSHAVLPPGDIFPGRVNYRINHETAAKDVAEGKRLYVWGNILYEDVFAKTRETRFCWYIISAKKHSLGMCGNPNHNTFE